MNPFGIEQDENDKPLSQSEVKLDIELQPFDLCNDLENAKLTRESILQKVQIVSDFLEEVREELIASDPTTAESEFQWGSPIKVGIRSCYYNSIIYSHDYYPR